MEQFDPLNLKVETEVNYNSWSRSLYLKTTLRYGDVLLSSSEIDISSEVQSLVSDNANRGSDW